MDEQHQTELALAKERLTKVSIAASLANLLGTPLDAAMERLPPAARHQVNQVTHKALEQALGAALFTLSNHPRAPSDRLHKAAAVATGAAGGALGLPALSIELPISTTIMLRSIADIARSEGEDMQSPAARLSCLEVLALGGSTPTDDAAETGYFALRASLAMAVSDAAKHLAAHGITNTGSPALVALITKIAARFSVNVSQKLAAQAVPAIGAAGGAIINSVFMDHFQNAAHGHFVIRRLERIYDPATVQDHYKARLS